MLVHIYNGDIFLKRKQKKEFIKIVEFELNISFHFALMQNETKNQDLNNFTKTNSFSLKDLKAKA